MHKILFESIVMELVKEVLKHDLIIFGRSWIILSQLVRNIDYINVIKGLIIGNKHDFRPVVLLIFYIKNSWRLFSKKKKYINHLGERILRELIITPLIFVILWILLKMKYIRARNQYASKNSACIEVPQMKIVFEIYLVLVLNNHHYLCSKKTLKTIICYKCYAIYWKYY